MRRIALVVSLGLLGCRDNPSGAGATASASTTATATTVRSFEGIYAIERITKNLAGCASEGPLVEPDVKFLALRRATSFGHPYLTGGAQKTLDEVMKTANLAPISTFHIVSLDQRLDSASPKGEVNGGHPVDGVCHGDDEMQSLRWVGPDTIRLELRNAKFEFPGKTISECGGKAEEEASVGKPCTELTVITARWQQVLPPMAPKP